MRSQLEKHCRAGLPVPDHCPRGRHAPRHPATGSQVPAPRDNTLPGVRSHPPAHRAALAAGSLLPALPQRCQRPRGQARAAARSGRTALARRGVFGARHSAEGSRSPRGMAHSPPASPPRGTPRQARSAQTPAGREGRSSARERLTRRGAAREPGSGGQDWHGPAQRRFPPRCRGPPCRRRRHGTASPLPPPCPRAALGGDGPAHLAAAPPPSPPSTTTPRADIARVRPAGSLAAPAEERRFCSPGAGGGRHPPLETPAQDVSSRATLGGKLTSPRE